MKILHINTNASGGAFTAALRLHEGLLNSDIDSTMLTLGAANRAIRKHVVFPQFSRYGLSIPKRIANKLHLRNLREIDRREAIEKLDHPVEYFSSPQTDYDIAQYINNKCDADIVHLHWVANFLDYPSFFRQLKKPVVWTLHDQAPFSSYWHYSDDYKNEPTARELHAKFMDIKSEALEGFDGQLVVATPSNWLKIASEKSAVLGHFPHHLIRYGIDTGVFQRQNEKPTSIREGQLEDKSIKILFICQALNNRRKGMDLLIDALKIIEQQSLVQLIAVGEPSEQLEEALGNRVIFTGTIQNEQELARIYSAVDCMVIPSRQDNLPNTLVESLSCGTPVVGTPAGGIAEILADEKLGVLAADFTSQSLAEALNNFINRKDDFEAATIEQVSHRTFKSELQAEKYRALYTKLVYPT